MPADPKADASRVYTTETLMPQVYDELRQLAAYRMQRETPGQTITGTALLHEVYLRLSKETASARWASRKQFFSAASEAMRRILIDRIRAKRRVKRGGEFERVEVDETEIASAAPDDRLLAINEALDELAKSDPDSADLVKLRYFVGFSLEEIAEALDVSVSTVSRQWAYARTWLADHLASNP